MLLTVLPAAADTLTIPNSFTDGTTASATQVNANFNAISTVVNGNITNSNIKSGAAISLAKLDLTSELFVLRAAANRCISAGTTGDTVPRVGFNSDGQIFFGPGGATATDLLIKRTDANTLAVRNAADNADKNLTVGAITGSGAASFDSMALTTKLTPANGGTGNTLTAAVGKMLVGDGTKFVEIGPGSSGQVPVSNGTTIAMGTPSSGSKCIISTKSAGFTANDATGTIYVITASSAIAVTLPASPADGTVYKFAIASGTAGVTFTANGAETIVNGGSVATTMTLASQRSGVVELVAVSGGWYVT
jgi:hypothetical protein